MTSPDDSISIDVPLSWVGYDEVPIAFANHVIVQFQPDGSFVVGIGQATPPPLIGTPEQIAEQAREIEFIPVRTLARVALTAAKMREFIAALSANLANFEQAMGQMDPRRTEP